jgi:hypothetical protein
MTKSQAGLLFLRFFGCFDNLSFNIDRAGRLGPPSLDAKALGRQGLGDVFRVSSAQASGILALLACMHGLEQRSI